MRIADLLKEERPREKLLKYGRESLSTAEILAIIIGTGSKEKSALDIGMAIISKDYGGLSYLAECKPEELTAIEGIGSAKACTLLAAVELGSRMSKASKEKSAAIKCSQDVANIFMERMRYYKKEYFISVLLNAKGEIIEEVKVSIGDLTSSVTHPREVFVEAVRRSASSVIFVHNHPSGDPTPSNADVETTIRLMEAGNLIGIPVLDHIVIGDGRFNSLKSMNLM